MKKIVLITGASSDIGSEIASLLGDSYEVILHYNNNYDEVMKLKDKLDKSWASTKMEHDLKYVFSKSSTLIFLSIMSEFNNI